MGVKMTTDITVDQKGIALCEFTTKYNAAYWANFLQTVGSNTSILKNAMIKQFPKYELTDFKYSQDADERTNKVSFKMLGGTEIKNGRWILELDQKDPDMTKLSDKDYLFMSNGNALKIHLPEGTTDAKVEKDTFGKAILTYPAESGGVMGSWPIFAGILLALGGGFLLFRNMKNTKQLKTVYDHAVPRDKLDKQKQGAINNTYHKPMEQSISSSVSETRIEEAVVVEGPEYRNHLSGAEMASVKSDLSDAEKNMLGFMDEKQQEKFLLAKFNEANGFVVRP